MKAVEHLEKAIALNPSFPEAYFKLGLLQKKTNETDEALKNFKKAVSLKNDFAEAECLVFLGVLKFCI